MSLPPVGEERDFHFSAAVHDSDGRQLGSLVRVVVDRESWDPVAIVVHERARFSGHALGSVLRIFPDEVVVPIEAVHRAGRERVDLTIKTTAFRRLPAYLAYQYDQVSPARAALASIAAAGGVTPGLPPFHEVANKADDQIEVRNNENVMIGHSGDRLGHIEDIVFDSGELEGAVVRLDRAHSGERVLVPVRFFDRSDDGALFVRITEAQVAQLCRADDAEPQ